MPLRGHKYNTILFNTQETSISIEVEVFCVKKEVCYGNERNDGSGTGNDGGN